MDKMDKMDKMDDEDHESLICKYVSDCAIDDDDSIILQWQHMLRNKNVVYNQDHFASKLYCTENNRIRNNNRKRVESYVCIEFPNWDDLNETKKQLYLVWADKLKW